MQQHLPDPDRPPVRGLDLMHLTRLRFGNVLPRSKRKRKYCYQRTRGWNPFLLHRAPNGELNAAESASSKHATRAERIGVPPGPNDWWEITRAETARYTPHVVWPDNRGMPPPALVFGMPKEAEMYCLHSASLLGQHGQRHSLFLHQEIVGAKPQGATDEPVEIRHNRPVGKGDDQPHQY